MTNRGVLRLWIVSAMVVLLSACQSVMPDDIGGLEKPTIAKRSGSSGIRTGTNSRAGTVLSSRRQPVASNRGVFYEGTDRLIGNGVLERPGAGLSDGNGITLNLVDVPIATASKTVLSDILKVNYFVDPQVKGKITIQTTNPVTRSGLIDMFEASLAASGAAIVQSGQLYKIVPSAQVTGAQPKLRIGRTPGDPNAVGKTTQIVPLRHVSASEMRRILEPISPEGSIVRVDTNRNLLVLQGTRHELASMLDNVSVFDVDWLRGMSFALIPVKTSDPEAIANELETVFANKKNGPLKGVVRFVPNKRLQSILVISKRSSYLRRATAWVRRLDAAARGSEKQLFVYNIQNRQAVELADLIQKVFAAEAQTSTDLSEAVAPGLTPAAIEGTAPGADGRTGAPPDAGAQDQQASNNVFSAITSSSDARIKVVADVSNNSLLILATPTDYDRVLQVVRKLDVIGKQVLLEATIAEVTLTDELKFGVKWFFEKGNSSFTLTDAASGLVAPSFPGFSYFFSAPHISAALDALQSITDVNVISSPSLMVLDNKTAVLQIGDQVPIATQSAVAVDTALAPTVNTIQFKDTGVILSVTPQVSDSGRVTLEIEQEVSNVIPTVTSGIDSPTIQQRKVKTTVVVQDGTSLALGGLIQVRDSDTRSQIPLLGDIPLLGTLFRQKSDTITKTELLIIITPRVVRDLEEARQVTNEFRRQLNVRIPRRRNKPNTQENINRIIE